MTLYRLTYESYPGNITVWEKTADELLMPNGSEPLLAWMLRESDARGYKTFTLEVVGDEPVPAPKCRWCNRCQECGDYSGHWHRPKEHDDRDVGPSLAEVALVTTDTVLGKGTYASINASNPHPSIQDAIARWRLMPEEEKPDVPGPDA